MKKLKCTGIYFLAALFFCCSTDNGMTQEQEAQNLSQLFSEIQSLAASKNCDSSSDWTFTSYGSKACGGPVGFIAYSLDIDTELFLDKLEKHRTAQQVFNKKWEISSDCSVPSQPNGVNCENGNPVFE